MNAVIVQKKVNNDTDGARMRLFYLGIFTCFILFNSSTTFATHHHAKKHHKPKQKPIAAASVDTPSQSQIYGYRQLNNTLNYFIANSNANANIAVYVKSMRQGDVLFSKNIYQSLTPASTMKILTAEAALLYLGPDYRFSTQLLTDAKHIKNGILQGNLYIVLNGDPSLTYYDLVDLLLSLRSQQIQAIAGNVYIDSSAYDQSFYGPGWEWKDKSYCYAAPISASIINHNCLSFKVVPAKSSGRNAQVMTSPKYFYPTIKNSVITKTNRGCNFHLNSDAGSTIAIDGCLSRNSEAAGVSYVVTDIPDYDRALFKNLLRRLSINVFGTVTFGNAPESATMLSQHASKPLRLLINTMLKKSDNVIAGALFKKLGQIYTRQPGSWTNGSYAVSQILVKQVNLNLYGLRMLDGSGLSAGNLTTSSQLMQVLDFAYHNYATSYEFISALPIAGVDGTLQHRMSNIARKVRAKTGTISGVVSLAGYVVSADREPLAFVIMINGDKGMTWRYRALEDRIATALASFKR